MAKQSLTVELDAETIRRLATLGEPGGVLLRLARSLADAIGHPAHARGDPSDACLRVERDRVDERSEADAMSDDEAVERWIPRHVLSWVEREATDRGQPGEQAQADTVLVDQREANEKMVFATLRAHELAEEADVAKQCAEASARHLQSMVEFRELFIGVLGHDLRNPLAAILMFAGLLLRRGHLGEQDARTVSQIIRSTQRMSLMITQLLDLTRARFGGGLPMVVGPTDLREVCRNVVEEFGAVIELEVEGDLTGLWDQDRLAQARSNLGGNAIEHATAGTAVSMRATADGKEVVVAVSNFGEPIDAEVLPVIFEPFRRGRQRAGSPPTHNLGLGLYIAHQIVLAHGGTLDARSVDGTTTFAMRLPRSPPPAPGGPIPG